MPIDTRYTDDVVLKKDALQNLLTSIKNYPVVDIDYVSKESQDELYKDNIWANYADNTPCIKIVYGDSNTTKGNIMFAEENKDLIQQIPKEVTRLNLILKDLQYKLNRWQKIKINNEELKADKEQQIATLGEEYTNLSTNLRDFLGQCLNLIATYMYKPNLSTLDEDYQEYVDYVEEFGNELLTNQFNIFKYKDIVYNNKKYRYELLSDSFIASLVLNTNAILNNIPIRDGNNYNAIKQIVTDIQTLATKYNLFIVANSLGLNLEEGAVLEPYIQASLSNYRDSNIYLTKRAITDSETETVSYVYSIYAGSERPPINFPNGYYELNQLGFQVMARYFNQVNDFSLNGAQLRNSIIAEISLLIEKIKTIIEQNIAIADAHIDAYTQDIEWLTSQHLSNSEYEELQDREVYESIKYIGQVATAPTEATGATINLIGHTAAYVAKFNNIILYQTDSQTVFYQLGTTIDEEYGDEIDQWLAKGPNRCYLFKTNTVDELDLNTDGLLPELYSIEDLNNFIIFLENKIKDAALENDGHPLVHGYKYVRVGDHVSFEHNLPSIITYAPSRDENKNGIIYNYPHVEVQDTFDFIPSDELSPNPFTQYYQPGNEYQQITVEIFNPNETYYTYNNGNYEEVIDLAEFDGETTYFIKNLQGTDGLWYAKAFPPQELTLDPETNTNGYYYINGPQRNGHIRITINGRTYEIGVQGLEYSDEDSINITTDMLVNGNILTGNGNIYASGGAIIGSTYIGIRNFPSINNTTDDKEKETAGFWYDGTENRIYTRNITNDDEINGQLGKLSNVTIGTGGVYNNNSNTTTQGGVTVQSGDIGSESTPWLNGYFINLLPRAQQTGESTNITSVGTPGAPWGTGYFESIHIKDGNTYQTMSKDTPKTFWRGDLKWSNRLCDRLIIKDDTVTVGNAKYKTDSTIPSGENNMLHVVGNGLFDGNLSANKVFHAVYNDYAEYRTTLKEVKPGQCVYDNDDGTLSISDRFLIPGAQIVSDTFGTSMGYTEKCQTPLAVAGRVLVYPYQDRKNYHAGMCVCSAPGGTVNIMSRKDIQEYPDCIIGIVSEIPNYEYWGTDNVKVDGRIWIKIK